MNTNDSRYNADDLPGDLLDGLNQLARHLDAQHYQGPAWSPVSVPRSRSRGRRLAASLFVVAGVATSACIVIAMIAGHRASDRPAANPTQDMAAAGITAPPNLRTISGSEVAVGDPPDTSITEPDCPQVVVVEDLDSYSVIDMSANSPFVSYRTKDESSFESPMPVPLGTQSPPLAIDRIML